MSPGNEGKGGASQEREREGEREKKRKAKVTVSKRSNKVLLRYTCCLREQHRADYTPQRIWETKEKRGENQEKKKRQVYRPSEICAPRTNTTLIWRVTHTRNSYRGTPTCLSWRRTGGRGVLVRTHVLWARGISAPRESLA